MSIRVNLLTEFLKQYLCYLTNDLINKKEELKKMKYTIRIAIQNINILQICLKMKYQS